MECYRVTFISLSYILENFNVIQCVNSNLFLPCYPPTPCSLHLYSPTNTKIQKKKKKKKPLFKLQHLISSTVSLGKPSVTCISLSVYKHGDNSH